MVADKDRFIKYVTIALDMLLIAVAYVLAWYLKFHSGIWELAFVFYLPGRIYLSALPYVVLGYFTIYQISMLYRFNAASSRNIDFFAILRANFFGAFAFLAILYLVKEQDFSRSMIAIFAVLNSVGQVGIRLFLAKIVKAMIKRGKNTRTLVMVGYSRAAEAFIDRIKKNPQWGFIIKGILDDSFKKGIKYKGVFVIGGIDELSNILAKGGIDETVITLNLRDYEMLEGIVSVCEKSGIHTKFVPDYNSVIRSDPFIEDISGLPVINIRRVPLTNGFNSTLKRLVDILGSVIAIAVFSPVMIIVAFLVRCSGEGPVIFKQERVGLNNQPFKMLKFRSMVVQDNLTESKSWTVKGDKRVTGIGKFIRKTSLDELPQLFNILLGDMSLVGPRPERSQFVDKFREEIPRYMIKHQVRPGLTGWAQVNGLRGDSSIKTRIEYDLFYIENWTLAFDLKVIFLTLFKGFVNKNAY